MSAYGYGAFTPCSRCGTPLHPGSQLCARCGAPVSSPQAATARRRSMGCAPWLMLFASALLGAAGGGGYAYLTTARVARPDAAPHASHGPAGAGAFVKEDVAVFDPRLLQDIKCAGCPPSPRLEAPNPGAPPRSAVFAYFSDGHGWSAQVAIAMQPDRVLRAGAIQDVAHTYEERARAAGTKPPSLDVKADSVQEIVERHGDSSCSMYTAFLHRTFVIHLSQEDKSCARPPKEVLADWTEKAKALVDRRFPG